MDVLINASNNPWIQLSIYENDISIILPILFDILSSKGINHPVEVGLNTIFVHAILCEFSLIPRVPQEHGEYVISVISVWMCNTIALEDLVALIKELICFDFVKIKTFCGVVSKVNISSMAHCLHDVVQSGGVAE